MPNDWEQGWREGYDDGVKASVKLCRELTALVGADNDFLQATFRAVALMLEQQPRPESYAKSMPRADYFAKHKACRACGSLNVETTTKGVLFPPDRSNTAVCGDCRWQGKVHDLREPPA